MIRVWPYSKERETIPADLILGLRLQGGSRNDSGLGHPHSGLNYYMKERLRV